MKSDRPEYEKGLMGDLVCFLLILLAIAITIALLLTVRGF